MRSTKTFLKFKKNSKEVIIIREEAFDRSRAFTFYREWLETAQAIEEEYGKEVTAEYFFALANYALHEIEPRTKTGPLKYLWPQTKEKIDASQDHRARGFSSKKDVELTRKIQKYKEEHPNDSQDKISKALGCSKGKVNSALRESDTVKNTTDTTNTTNTITPTTTSVTVTVTDEDLLDDINNDPVLVTDTAVSEELLKLTILNNWKKGRSIVDTADIVNKKLGTSIDRDYVKEVFDASTANDNFKGMLEREVENQERKKRDRELTLKLIEQVINPCRKAGIPVSEEDVMRGYEKNYGTQYGFNVSSLGSFISDNKWSEEDTFADVMAKWITERENEINNRFEFYEPPVRPAKTRRRGLVELEEAV